MTIDFYYWGAACPLNVEMLALEIKRQEWGRAQPALENRSF